MSAKAVAVPEATHATLVSHTDLAPSCLANQVIPFGRSSLLVYPNRDFFGFESGCMF